MTKEEAIHFAKCLKNNWTIDFNDMADFCDMAISALSVDGDIISRADAIEALCHNCAYYTDAQCKTDSGYWCESGAMIREDIPSAEAVSREFYEDAIKANHGLARELANLKQEFESADRPNVAYICDGKACDGDCTECSHTRQIEHAKHFICFGDSYMESSADRPMGEWIEREDWNGDYYYDCSVCGESFVLCDGTPSMNLYYFCPNCGADMRGDK